VDLTKVGETDTPLKMSQFAESVSYIYLSEEPLLGDIKMSPLKIIEDTIYIDRENIYKYTPEGKFTKKLFKEGQGPGEAMKYEITRTAFNRKERYVTFSSKSYDSYVHHSFDGDFLGNTDRLINETSTKLIETYFNHYCIYRIDQLLKRGFEGNRLGPNLFYAEDLNTHSVFYSYPNYAADEVSLSIGGFAKIIPADMNFMHVDTVLWFKHYVVDTLYSTRDFVSILPRYIFKTDRTFMNLREYTQLMVLALDRERSSTAKIIKGVLPLPTGDLLFTVNGKIAFADKKGKTSDYTEKLVVNDIDDHLAEIDITWHLENRTFSIYKNHLYLLVDAFKFFDEGGKPPFKELTEDSNPVVVKIKLKTE
jgi:hypothetical protein